VNALSDASPAPFSAATRAAALAAMAAQPVDVLVVGAGIVGASVARDAAMRGFRTALIDRGDFGCATSSRSSRLIHGGLRYLETGDLRLVFEATHERRTLLRIAPHLVRPLAFIMPAYAGSRVPPWKLRAGMWLYDALAGFRNVRRHRWLAPREALRADPGLRQKGLRGAALYYDAQVDDARFVLATARSAARAGALVANYAEVTSLLKPDGTMRGAVVRDVLSGSAHTVRALAVVNATGPWVDALRRLDDPNARPLLRLSKGAHVAVPRTRLASPSALTLISPIDGRVMFVLPWNEVAYIGTTETDHDGPPDEVRATGEDVVYLLRSANAFFPEARLTPDDVLSTWAGLRALVDPKAEQTAGAVSREHKVVESPSGLVTIAGGKLTTCRLMAWDVVDTVAARLRRTDGRPVPPRAPTDKQVLPGSEAADFVVLVDNLLVRNVKEPVARHLVANYGSEAAAIVNLVEKNRVLGRPLIEGRPEIRAEVAHAVEREMAVRLSDVLARRLHLFQLAPAASLKVAGAVARKMRELLGWDGNREADEVAGYQEEVKRARLFLTEVARGSHPRVPPERPRT
jgi:glycerol-3-phosphate dehydrogenase